MITLSNLPKVIKKNKKRLGRGYGSGKSKTAGRGTKGQKAREKVKFGLEGGQLPLIKRLPMMRGKDKFKPKKKKPLILNIKYLNFLPERTIVDLESLVKYRLVEENGARKFGVKILGDGELNKSLIVKLPCSHSAEEKIQKAGGRVES